jgi:hypothetical protein
MGEHRGEQAAPAQVGLTKVATLAEARGQGSPRARRAGR